MPSKSHRFSPKEDRQAKHIAASMKSEGKSSEEAKRIGYATVVSRGGGKKRPSNHMVSSYRNSGNE